MHECDNYPHWAKRAHHCHFKSNKRCDLITIIDHLSGSLRSPMLLTAAYNSSWSLLIAESGRNQYSTQWRAAANHFKDLILVSLKTGNHVELIWVYFSCPNVKCICVLPSFLKSFGGHLIWQHLRYYLAMCAESSVCVLRRRGRIRQTQTTGKLCFDVDWTGWLPQKKLYFEARHIKQYDTSTRAVNKLFFSFSPSPACAR